MEPLAPSENSFLSPFRDSVLARGRQSRRFALATLSSFSSSVFAPGFPQFPTLILKKIPKREKRARATAATNPSPSLLVAVRERARSFARFCAVRASCVTDARKPKGVWARDFPPFSRTNVFSTLGKKSGWNDGCVWMDRPAFVLEGVVLLIHIIIRQHAQLAPLGGTRGQ